MTHAAELFIAFRPRNVSIRPHSTSWMVDLISLANGPDWLYRRHDGNHTHRSPWNWAWVCAFWYFCHLEIVWSRRLWV